MIPTPPRILGEPRIFQAVVNDLGLRYLHAEVEGRQRWVYVFEGVDPYQLEDGAFPTITAAVEAAEHDARLRGVRDYITQWYGNRCETRDRDDFPDLSEDDSARCVCCVEWDRYDEWARSGWSQGDANPLSSD